MFCFKCGQDNSPGANFCSKCNAVLPKFHSNVSPTASAPKTQRLMKYIDIVNKIIDGNSPHEELYQKLEVEEQSLKTAGDKLRNTPIDKSLRAEFKPQIDTALSGIKLFLESIDSVKQVMEQTEIFGAPLQEDGETIYFELSEENQKACLDAIELAKEANEYFNQSYEMSEESVRKVKEEDYMYEDDTNIL